MERHLILVNDDDSYTANLEYVDGWFLMHCEVHKTAPSTIKRIKEHIKLIKHQLEETGYTLPLISATRNQHFSRLIGGKKIGEVVHGEDILGVWSWE